MNKLTGKKKAVYGLVLAAALIGLMVDQLSQGASSAAPAKQAAVAGAVLPAAIKGGEPAISGPTIARVFELAAKDAPGKDRVSDRTSVRNAFKMSLRMEEFYEQSSGAGQAEEQKKIETEQELRRKQVAAFEASHKLKGTTLKGQASWAIINDQVVRVGEKIDGFELLRVERYRVHLTRGDVEVVLSLPLP